MGNYDKQLMEFAGRQHFVVARDQLLDLGSRRQVERRMKNGLLERVYECAYRIAGSPATWEQSVVAACFAGGKQSVASFRTACRIWDLPGGEEVCEVTSPPNRRARHDSVIPHESRFLEEHDVTHVDNIPVTRTARTIIDMGLLVERGEVDPHVLELAMLEAVRRDLVDLRQVWLEWERMGGAERPGGRAVEKMLDRFVPPTRSGDTKPEMLLLSLVRRAGLPEPIPQFRVWLSPTRWVDLDLAWPDHKVFAEFDSYKWHGDRDRYMRTIARRIEVEALGWHGVPVTDDELNTGAPLALGLLTRLLHPEGGVDRPPSGWPIDASLGLGG